MFMTIKKIDIKSNQGVFGWYENKNDENRENKIK